MYTPWGILDSMKPIQNRIRRLRGQLESLEATLMNNEQTCAEVLPQLLAVKGSFDSLVSAYLEHALDGCIQHEKAGSMRQVLKLLISKK